MKSPLRVGGFLATWLAASVVHAQAPNGAAPPSYPPPAYPYGAPPAYPPPAYPYGAPPAYPPPVYPYGAPPSYPPPAYPYGAPPSSPLPPAAPPPSSASEGGSSNARHNVTTIGLGLTAFGQRATSPAGTSFTRPGVALDLASRFPIGSGFGLGFRFAWGLTEFHRFSKLADAGYRVGAWTTQAYKDVWCWTGRESYQPFRAVAGVNALLFLMLPYFGAGALYALAPVATTTYLEFDFTASYEFGDDGRGGGVPYVQGGLGLVGYLHPQYDVMLGGVGPMLGAGMRLGHFDASFKGTWLPPHLHGEASSVPTSTLIGTVGIGVAF